MVKKNNIFSVNDDDLTMKLVESNLAVHMTTTHKPVKKSLKFVSVVNLKAHSEGFLKIILSKGPNPYKVVEMWKNNCPKILHEKQGSELYKE